MKRLSFVALLIVLLASLFLALPTTTAHASAWCGNGSAPNYGFDDSSHFYDLKQTYWVVSNNLVTVETQQAAETVLNKLNDDQLAQTMVLVIPTNQVGDSVNCADHFGRYMKLGLPDGPHRDNGFVWLFMVNSDNSLAEVNYGVGLGLNALTAPGLGDLKRVGTDTYASTKSVDASVLALVNAYSTYVRSKYQTAPSVPVVNNPASQPLPAQQTGGNTGPSALVILFIIFIGVLVVFGIVAFFSNSGFSSNSTDDSEDDTSYSPPSYAPSYSEPEETHESPRHSEPSHPSYTPPAYHPSPSPTPHNPPSTPHSGSGGGGFGRGG